MAELAPVFEGRSLHGPLVVMGVSGCGKTSVGERLARDYGVAFLEGDSVHPEQNIRKMKTGQPLTDTDRWPWLDEIGRQIHSANSIVVSCSALKRSYRDRLRQHAVLPPIFLFLQGTRALLANRLEARNHEFMPTSLLDSQLATLEPPFDEPDVITIDVALPIETIIETAILKIAQRHAQLLTGKT